VSKRIELLRKHGRPSVILAVAAVAVSLPSIAAAQTSQWIGATSDWNTASNWSPSGVPGFGDVANVTSSLGLTQTITYDYTGAAVTLGTLSVNLTGGTGTASEILSMAGNSLRAVQENVGGYSGSPASGVGTFIQSGGINSINGPLFLGDNFADQGFYTLSGGDLNTSGAEYIGQNGVGSLNQSGGTNNYSGGLDLGYNVGSTGTYTLSGGSLANPNAQASEEVGFYGTGIFDQTGGTNTLVQANTPLEIAFFPGSTGTYTLSGGLLSVDLELVGDRGAGYFNQTGGTNKVVELGVATNGGNSQTTNVYSLSGTGTIIAGSESIGSPGYALFNQSGGTNTIKSGGLDVDGVSGVYLLSGTGVLSAGSPEYVGNEGAGNFNQSGGTNTVATALYLAYSSGSTGTYVLSGGTLTVNGSAYVGGSNTGPGGMGILAVSNTGVVNISGTLAVYNISRTGVTLSGGTINTASLNFNGAPSLFNWTGGTLGLTSGVTFDPGAAATSTSAAFGSSLMLGANQTLNVTGNETLGGNGSFALTLNGGSTHSVTGTLTVNSKGTLTQNGGSLSAAALNGDFTQSGGTAAFGQITGGQLAISGGQTTLASGGGTSQLGGLAMSGGGALDISNNPLLVNYTTGTDPIKVIVSYLTDGYRSGWTGGEIQSSSVAGLNASQSGLIYNVGYADGADGITHVPSGQIEILPTIDGDCKLQGNVVFGDFQLISQYFGQSNTTWDEGNFTYGSMTNFGDFQLLSQNFGASASNLTAGELASVNGFAAQFGDEFISNGAGYSLVSVPEPASAAITALIAAGLLCQRRRRMECPWVRIATVLRVSAIRKEPPPRPSP
jgi:hypothetical protein